MEGSEIMTGDIISIKGNKLSTGIAWLSHVQDYGLGIVRLDSRLRKNTETNIDNIIEVDKVDAFTAQNVILVPIRIAIKLTPNFELFVRKKLINYPVTLDDIIYFSIGISKEIPFKVISLTPMGICVIQKNTNLQISDIIADD